MKSRTFVLLLLAPVCLVSSCGSNIEGEQAIREYVATADSMAVTEGGDLSDPASSARKVVYKADIRCRVADVETSVTKVEKFVTLAGGFVQESRTHNNVVNEKTVAYGADSLKTVQQYNTDAQLVIRIPNYALDTLLTVLSSVSDFTDYRNLAREDMTLQFLSNILTNRALDELEPAIKQHAKMPADTSSVQQQLQANAIANVDRKIANLGMQDDSKYATLAISLYQPARAAVYIKQDTDGLLSAGFWERAANSLRFSINIIKEATLVAISLWPVIMLAGLLFLYFRKGKRRSAAKAV